MWEKFEEVGRSILIIGLLCLTAVMTFFMLVTRVEDLLDKGTVLSQREMREYLETTDEILIKGSRLSIDQERSLYINGEKIGHVRFKMEEWFQHQLYVYTMTDQLIGYSAFVEGKSSIKCLNYDDNLLGYVVATSNGYLFYSKDLSLVATSEVKSTEDSYQILDIEGKCLYEIKYQYDFWRDKESFLIQINDEGSLDLVAILWMIYGLDVS